MLTDITLHGALGERFGTHYRLDVLSPAEAVHALGVQLRGFLAHLSEGAYQVIRGPLRGGEDIGEDEILMRLGSDREIHIVPAMAGAGASTGGIIKLVAGAALVAAAVAFSGGTAAGLALPLLAGLPVTFGNVALLGFGVALAGASSLLAQPPATNAGEIDPRTGAAFGNVGNVAAQNGPVPIVCGRFVTTPLLISFGLDAERVSSSNSGGVSFHGG